MKPGADDDEDAVLLEPVAHGCVAGLARVECRERERLRRDAGTARAFERPKPLGARRDRDDGKAVVEKRLEVRSLPRDEHADHRALAICSDHEAIAGLWNDGEVADPEVEDATELELVDVLGEPGEDGRPLPRAPVDLRRKPRRQHALEVAEDAAAGDVREGMGAAAEARARRRDRGASARAGQGRRSRPARAGAGSG